MEGVELGSVKGGNLHGRYFTNFNSRSQISVDTCSINTLKEWDAARKNYEFLSTFQIPVSIPIIYGFPILVEVFRHER